MCGAAADGAGAEPLRPEIMWGWGPCAGRINGCGAIREADGMRAFCEMFGTEMRGDDTGGITTRGARRGAEGGGEKCGAVNARIPPPPPKCPPAPGRATAGVAAHAAQMSRIDVM